LQLLEKLWILPVKRLGRAPSDPSCKALLRALWGIRDENPLVNVRDLASLKVPNQGGTVLSEPISAVITVTGMVHDAKFRIGMPMGLCMRPQ